MIASNKKYYLSYFNKLVLIKNTYLCLVFSLTENIEINLKRLNLKLVIESGLLSKRIFLVKVTQNIGKKKIFAVNSVLKTNPRMYKVKDLNGKTIRGSFYEKELLSIKS